MSAGRRNRLITIQRPVVTVSNTGSTTQAWETFVSLWAEMKDRTSTGVENEHASTTLSIRRADWVIRQTTGITPAMRIIYDNTVWDILAINSLSYDRNKMLLVTEQRASLTADDVATCPTLCERIDAADAQDIVDCLSAEQETAVKALICPSSDPATYTNGAAFTQVIAGGETYTAPQVTMTAVDGTTEDIPANIDYTCEWKVLTGNASDGTPIVNTEIAKYPSNGEYILPDRRIADAGGNVIILPYRQTTNVLNANLASAVNDTPNTEAHNLTIEVNVPVNNSAGDSVGSNVDDLLNPHVLPDLPVTDNDGAVGSYSMPTALVIDGTVDSASYTSGTLTITPAGSTPTGLIYQRSGFRGFQPTLVDYDLGWQVNAGTYNYGNGTGIRVSYGSGADRFYRVAPLNAFGNNLRYTDSVGGGAADDLAQWSTVDWALRPTAIPYYVIDHLTGLAWIIVKIGFAETWDNALATAHGLSYGGFSDYRVPSSGEIEDVYNGANVPQFYGSGNIFFRSSFFVSGTETGMWLNSYLTGSTTLANFFNDSGEVRLANRTTGTGRATYAVRTHYPAP